jgi:glycosyltransferase involved in cell wall biosynthesis
VPGVDTQVFTKNPTLNTKKMPTSETDAPMNVLAFASETPFKGFYDTVLPAFNYVHRVLGRKVEFHLFGNVEAIQFPYEFGKQVIAHSHLDDKALSELYRSCDLFVSGSWAESSPLPHLESMASGCPVVCTEYGTEHYGEALVRVKPKAPRLLGETILNVLDNVELREKMSQLGTLTAQEFTWQKTVDNAERFFKELIGE